jgi:hypothetical protein
VPEAGATAEVCAERPAGRRPLAARLVAPGYEINFYRYTPPRPLEEIEVDIRGIETDIMRMLSEVTGGAPASARRRD